MQQPVLPAAAPPKWPRRRSLPGEERVGVGSRLSTMRQGVYSAIREAYIVGNRVRGHRMCSRRAQAEGDSQGALAKTRRTPTATL